MPIKVYYEEAGDIWRPYVTCETCGGQIVGDGVVYHPMNTEVVGQRVAVQFVHKGVCARVFERQQHRSFEWGTAELDYFLIRLLYNFLEDKLGRSTDPVKEFIKQVQRDAYQMTVFGI